MQISAVNTYIVPQSEAPDGWTSVKTFLFVRVETDTGLHGWGEAYVLTDREHSMARLIEELGRYLVGRDPFRIRQFSTLAYRAFAEKRAGIEFYSALSALEIALWDIVGKALQRPVYDLLGGACRSKIKLYGNFWSDRPGSTSGIVERAVGLVKQGFKAVKIYPLQCPDLDAAVERVRLVRQAIGYDIDLMVDLSGPDDPHRSVELAKRIEPFKVSWVEEPVASENLELLARLTSRIAQPVVSGERLCGKQAFRDVLERRSADILNPDIAACGGILEFLDIAAMAAAFSIPVTPHNYNSMTVGMAAMLQVSAIAPNFLIAEYFPYFASISEHLAITPFRVVDGWVDIPAEPGIGVDLDLSVLQAIEPAEGPQRLWPDEI